MSADLTNLMRLAAQGGAEYALPSLFSAFSLNDPSKGTLSKIQTVMARLDEYGLEIVPPLTVGEIESVRLIKFPDSKNVSAAQIMEQIAEGESQNVEFKSSLLFPRNPEHANLPPSAKLAISKELVHSSLKSIAAFLNSSGGTLYIGVRDDASICGIEDDFAFITPDIEKQNADMWQLHFRNLMKSSFKDGASISPYITCDLVRFEHGTVARLRVAKRRTALSFLQKDKGDYRLFERDGNQTREITFVDIEDFFARRGFVLS